MGVVMPVTLSVLTPGLLAVNVPGVKPLATITCAAVADLTSHSSQGRCGQPAGTALLKLRREKYNLWGTLMCHH